MLRRRLKRKSPAQLDQERKERQEKKTANPIKPPSRSPVRVGTIVERALKLVGVTPERMEVYFKSCGCRRRRDRLNKMSDIAWSVLRGKMTLADARREFDKITNGETSKPDTPPQESTS